MHEDGMEIETETAGLEIGHINAQVRLRRLTTVDELEHAKTLKKVGHLELPPLLLAGFTYLRNLPVHEADVKWTRGGQGCIDLSGYVYESDGRQYSVHIECATPVFVPE
jgi:hypothetical protein